MPFDAQAFVTEILKDIQVDDTAKQVLIGVASNPTISKRLEEGYLRQSEFSRLSSEYQTKLKNAQTYWDELAKWKQDEEARLEQERQSLKSKPTGTDDTQEDFNKKLQQLANESLTYMNTLSTVQMKHFKEFGEILDPQDVIKVATNDKVPFDIAYERHVTPKRLEIQKKEFEKQLEDARKQGAEEALKNYKIPVAETTFAGSGMPHALDRFDSKEPPEFGAMAAIRAYASDKQAGKVKTDSF